MPLFENNLSPYLTIVESTEPAAPSAGQQRLYIDSTTHKLMRTNSSGTETSIETTAGTSQVISAARAAKTSGDTSLTSTSEASFDTGTDLTLAAATNDWCLVWINALHDNSNKIVNLDVATIVSASPVHYFGAGLASSAQGLLGWSKQAAAYTPIAGTAMLQLASGDISGGNVVLRLRYKVNAATSLIYSSSNTAFYWGAQILRLG